MRLQLKAMSDQPIVLRKSVPVPPSLCVAWSSSSRRHNISHELSCVRAAPQDRISAIERGLAKGFLRLCLRAIANRAGSLFFPNQNPNHSIVRKWRLWPPWSPPWLLRQSGNEFFASDNNNKSVLCSGICSTPSTYTKDRSSFVPSQVEGRGDDIQRKQRPNPRYLATSTKTKQKQSCTSKLTVASRPLRSFFSWGLMWESTQAWMNGNDAPRRWRDWKFESTGLAGVHLGSTWRRWDL